VDLVGAWVVASSRGAEGVGSMCLVGRARASSALALRDPGGKCVGLGGGLVQVVVAALGRVRFDGWYRMLDDRYGRIRNGDIVEAELDLLGPG